LRGGDERRRADERFGARDQRGALLLLLLLRRRRLGYQRLGQVRRQHRAARGIWCWRRLLALLHEPGRLLGLLHGV
jgi:hypothetical protein